MKKLRLLGFSFFLAAFLFGQNVPRPTETPGSIEDALAAAMLETALKLEPDNSYFLQSAVDHYFERGLPEKAMALYGPGYPARIDKDGVALRIYASYWAERKENLDSALAAARKSVELTPNAVAWNSLALVLFTMGKNEEALKAEEKAIELDGGQNPRYKTMRDRIKAALEKK